MRQWVRWLAVMTLTLAIAATQGGVVSAHARLKSSEPPDKAVLTKVPAQVTLIFGEETSATMSDGSVVSATGATVSTGFQVDLNDRTKMTITLMPNLGFGTYTVRYHTLTEDDNGMVDGSISFSVQGLAAGASSAPASTGAPVGGSPAVGVVPAGTARVGSASAGAGSASAVTSTVRPTASASVVVVGSATIAPTATRAATVAPTTAPTIAAPTAAATVATATLAPLMTDTPPAARTATPASIAAPIATGVGGVASPTPAVTNPTTGVPISGVISWAALIVVVGAGVALAGFGLRLRAR